jgi:hypothetical protein
MLIAAASATQAAETAYATRTITNAINDSPVTLNIVNHTNLHKAPMIDTSTTAGLG